LLPQRWLTEFRHLFEVAAPLANGLRLESYHASLISATLNGQADRQALSLPDFQDLGEYELPGQLEADLRDYQRAGYNWLCFLHDYALGGILADDMGLGKTLQTLALLQRTYEQGAEAPSLIVVPNSIIYNWQLEAQRFCPALKVLIYTGAKRHNLLKQFYDYHVILTTYGIIRQDEAHLSPITFEHVVLDESHLIKNREAKTTQAVFQLQGRQKLTLTGTPIENTTMDLWTQMHFLNPRLLGSAAFFERHYAHPIEKERNEDRAAKLRSLTRPFIMRRTKEMVAQDLPPKSEQVHYCNMTPDQEAVYERTKQLYRATLFKDENDTAEIFARNRMQVLSSIQRLRQIAIHPRLIQPEVTTSGKYEQMKEMLTEVLAENSKVLIFSQFVKLLKIIAEDLRRDGIGYSYLDGSTKTSARAEAVRKFQEEDAHRAFLISLKAGGVGLNLTAAEYVFMMDPWWNPAVEQQAINRAHRIGQDKSVFVYKFITRNTIEEKIQQLQHRKLQIAGEVIKSEEKFFKSLTKADLESLFE
jgi:SNF2 family DNA or RNA helicase